MKKKWSYSFHPINNQQNTNVLWWKYQGFVSSSVAGVDSNRLQIDTVLRSQLGVESLNAPVVLAASIGRVIAAGYNRINHKPDFYRASRTINTVLANEFYALGFDNTDQSNLYNKLYAENIISRTVGGQTYKEKLAGFPLSPYVTGNTAAGISSVINTDVNLDVYGPNYEVPMQGPFTEKFVGGSPHRHQDIFNTSSNTRAESYVVSGNDYKNPFISNANLPRSDFYRDGTAKRPVNISNIKMTTGTFGTVLGNYSKNYELVLGTRDNINSYFVKNNSIYTNNASLISASSLVSDAYESPNPNLNRTRNESAFVSRFSAPGGPEVNGAYLDQSTEQYSVYNALPFRNLHIRSYVNNWFTSASLHGYTSASTTLPSFHKVPMNSYSSSAGRIRRDNYWVTRPIPSSDTNFQWINESITSTSSATGYDFTQSGSITGSYSSQMTYYVQDPFETSGNVIGYDGGAITNYKSFAIANNADLLQVLNLKRNGTYQHPSWKQIRKGENSAAKFLRTNNIYSFATSSQVVTGKSSSGTLRLLYPVKSITSAVEPALTNTKPLDLIFEVNGNLQSISVSYYNSLMKFTNSIANNNSYNKDIPYSLVSLLSKDYEDMKRVLNDDYLSKDLKLKKVIQKQTLFPKENNRFLNTTRIRNQHTETTAQRDAISHRTFWRDSYTDRKRSLTALNSQGVVELSVSNITGSWYGDTKFANFTSSVWPLDIYASGGVSGSSGYAGGELVLGELWSAPTPSSITGYALRGDSGKLVASAQYLTSSTSFISRLGWSWTFLGDDSDLQDSFGAMNYSGGTAFQQANNAPWYDSYTSYASQFRLQSKDMSILPEFRISEQLPMFVTGNGFNFNTTDNSAFLSIDGADIANSSQTNFYKVYSQAEFIKNIADIKKDLGVNETKLKLKFKGIKKLLPYNGFYPSTRMVQMASLFSSSFGGQFSGAVYESADYNQFTSGNYIFTGSSGIFGYNLFFNSLYSPGISFNTVKSGIASTNRLFYNPSVISGAVVIGLDTMIKQKFETIIEPDVYLSTGNYMMDMDHLYVHTASSTDEYQEDYVGAIQANWSGYTNNKLYNLAAHNYYGESTRFFLKNQSTNTFLSQPESKFSSLISGATYYMDIVLRASSWDFMMYNNKNFNVTNTSSLPYTQSRNYSIPSSYITNSLSYRGIAFSNGAGLFGTIPNIDPYFANTPCYFYGDSVVRASFYCSSSKKYTASEILSSLTYTHMNKDNFASFNGAINYSSSVVYAANAKHSLYPYFSASPLDYGYVHNMNNNVLDSVNIAITKIPKTTYDQDGNAISVQDSKELAGYDAISISTKYETPIFNFSSSIPNGKSGGIWTAYNESQVSNQGIFLEIQDSFPSYRNSNKAVNQTLTGSLIKVLGFDSKNASKQLGQLADQKLISEAVVAIPIKKDGSKYALDYTNFNYEEFELPSLDTFYALKSVDTKPSDSVRKMINSSKKYILPPHLDFNNNPSVKPFSMYIFEFEHMLDKQDLARIWQNVMPKIAQNHEIVETEIEHELKSGELLEVLDDETRWIVFKVKRRAEFNYYSVTADTQDDTKFNFNFTIGNSNTSTKKLNLPYSYNWPYDYFSLIEVGQMDAEVELEKK